MKKILVLGAVIIIVMTIALIVIKPKETQAPQLDQTNENSSTTENSDVTDNTPNDNGNTPAVSGKLAFNSSLKMKVGQSVEFTDGLVVTLKNINDSRCKPDVQCIWIGELAPVLEITGGMLGSKVQEVQLGMERVLMATVSNYTFTLNNSTETQIELTVTK